MFDKVLRPKWWVLYGIVLAAMGLFVLEIKQPFSPREHRIAELVLVSAVFGLIWVWLGVNDAELRAEEWRTVRERAPRRTIYTALGQFATATSAGERPRPTSARVPEVESVEEGPESTTWVNRAALTPAGVSSLPQPQPVLGARGETPSVTSFAIRSS